MAETLKTMLICRFNSPRSKEALLLLKYSRRTVSDAYTVTPAPGPLHPATSVTEGQSGPAGDEPGSDVSITLKHYLFTVSCL